MQAAQKCDNATSMIGNNNLIIIMKTKIDYNQNLKSLMDFSLCSFRCFFLYPSNNEKEEQEEEIKSRKENEKYFCKRHKHNE